MRGENRIPKLIDDEGRMFGQQLRLLVLLLTLNVGILLHLFVVFINIYVRYCWSTNEFWHV